MGLVELLDQIRAEHLDELLSAIEEKSLLPATRVITEPALRLDDGTLAIEGELQLPARIDFAVLQGDTPTELLNVESDTMLAFDAVEFDWGKTLHVEMGAFAWHGFPITMPDDPSYNWVPLQEWFWKWFHDEDEEEDDPDLLGAVHFLSDPVLQDDVIEFSVDLGSAPVAAFEEMLDAFATAGVTLCAIGQVVGKT